MTPLPFVYSALIPTPTPARDAIDLDIEDCVLADNWPEYVVQEGENLLTIADSIGSSLLELRSGNCFDALQGAIAGETILLPNLPQVMPATAIPIFPDDQVEIPLPNCESAAVQILLPEPMHEVTGVFTLSGNTDSTAIRTHLVEIRPGWSDTYWIYRQVEPNAGNEWRTLINTEVFGTGLHWLRVSQLDENGEATDEPTCEIPLIFIAP